MRFTFILIITTIFLWSNSLFSQSSIEVNIDLLELHKWLENAPSEQAISITHQFSVITLPNEKGESIDFLAFDSPILSPQLQEQFPSIKTYRIEGIDFPSYHGRITVSDFGASAMIYSDNGRYLIRPKASNNAHEVLLAPYEAQKIHLEGRQDIVLLNKTHTHEEKNIEHNHEDHVGLRVFTSSQGMSNRRVVDVFITADYEYYVANGNNNSAVMTAITNQINSVNMIYQRDLNVRLALSNVAFFANDADDNAYFAGPSNAVPEHIDNALNYFDAVVLSDVAGDNITGAVTLNSFDLGFYFSGKTDAANASGAGAALSAHEAGILCDDDAWDGSNVVSNDGMIGGNLAPLKGGAGASAGGAAFASQTWIDVVAHEMGHAFGALHTWTSNQESCTSDQFDTPQSYELGSGSTLMSYLGICGDENAGNEPDDNIMVAMSEDNAYFHIGSIFHIDNYLNGAAGTLNCITTEANGNSNIPAIQIPAANATASIPANTPFALTGTATDADNDMLTYNWEQVDQANAAFNFSFAAANSTTSAPLIRSRQPSTEATRYIPILNDLATGGDANMAHPYELLPTSSANGRMLDFQFSARDQKGGLVSRTVKLTVDTNIPELDVTSQNTSGISYNGLSTQTITWTN
ncbi:MAG: M12 family metallo-peptidase, partial [Bacteroidota bacterium]